MGRSALCMYRGIHEFDQFHLKAEFARISAIKLGQLSIDEPHSSYHLIVITDYHLNLRECRLVSQEGGEGWSLDSSLTMRPVAWIGGN